MKKQPVASRILCVFFAFVMMLLSLGTVACSALCTTLTRSALHEEIATSESVLKFQKAAIGETVAALHEKYGVTESVLQGFVSLPVLAQYNRDAVNWWMGLLKPNPSFKAPEINADAIEAAVLADAGFLQATPEDKQDSVAKKKVAVALAKEVQETVIPFRSQLISLGFSKVSERIDIPHYGQYLPYLPWVCALLALVMAGGMALLCAGRKGLFAGFAGSAITAAGLLCLLAGAALQHMNLPAVVSAYSGVLGLQVSLFLSAMSNILLPWVLAMTALGLAGVGYAMVVAGRKPRA